MRPEGKTNRRWAWTRRWRPWRSEFWVRYPATADGGNQVLRVCDRSGYDFAVLSWRTCWACRHGHIATISISPQRQRRGYGTRMVRRAMHGCDSYTWTTIGQSPDAQRFFPVLAAASRGTWWTVRWRMAWTCRA